MVKVVALLGLLGAFLFGSFLFVWKKFSSEPAVTTFEGQPTLLAVIDEQEIPLSHLDRTLEIKYWQKGKKPLFLSPKHLAESRKGAWEGVLDELLLRLEVRKDPPAVPQEEIIEAIHRFQKKFPNDELLDAVMRNQGWHGKTELEGRIREKLSQEAYLARKIVVKVTEEDLQELYQTQREQLIIPERIHARHVFFAALDHPREKALDWAKSVKAQIAIGSPFASLAEEFSDDLNSKKKGGDLGWMTRDRLPVDFAEKVFALPEKEVSIIESKLGIHVVEVLAKRPERIRSFEEARVNLKQELLYQKKMKRLRHFLNGLRSRYRIDVNQKVFLQPWSFGDKDTSDE